MPGLIHRLNNRLQTITAIVELLQRRSGLPENLLASLGKIETNAQLATSMLREFAAEYIAQGPGITNVDLRKLCEEAVAGRAIEYRRAGIAVTIEPEAAVPCRVRASEPSLHQALLNLLVNAEQALEGRSGGRIIVRLEPGATAAVSVIDNGPGVDAAIRDRIFEPFFTTRKSETALGLGLTVASEIVRHHGGTLAYAPEGAGATFVLRIPATS
jgi:signal transduction histidine kinase